ALGSRAVGNEEDEVTFVRFGVDDPGSPGDEVVACGHVHRAGDGGGCVFFPGTRVQQQGARVKASAHVGTAQGGQGSAFPQEGCTGAVLYFHAAEVGGCDRLLVKERGGEAVDVTGFDERCPPGGDFFVTDGARRDGAEGFPAGTARSVARHHLHVIGQFHEHVTEAVEQFSRHAEAGVFPAGGFVEQVGPADVADEHEVAGEQEAGLVAGRVVGDEERQVFRGVARRVERVDGYVGGAEAVAVPEYFMREAVQPVGTAFCGEVEAGAGCFGEFAGAGEVVGMDVRFRHPGDFQAVLCGLFQVHVNVAARVDYEGGAFSLAAYEPACLGQIF